jgi:hypothetical protein
VRASGLLPWLPDCAGCLIPRGALRTPPERPVAQSNYMSPFGYPMRPQGDSPTPSCPVSLPGIPYREGASLAAAEQQQAAPVAAPRRRRQQPAVPPPQQQYQQPQQHQHQQGGPPACTGAQAWLPASSAGRPTTSSTTATLPEASPAGSDVHALLQGASPGGRQLCTRLSWLIEQNQQELRNLLEWQQEQQLLQQFQGQQEQQQDEGHAAGSGIWVAGMALEQRAAGPGGERVHQQDRQRARGPDKDQGPELRAAQRGAAAPSPLCSALGGAAAASGGNNVSTAAAAAEAAVAAAAAAAGNAVSGGAAAVISALQRAGASPGSPPWPLPAHEAAAAEGADGASDAPGGRRVQRRRQRSAGSKRGEDEARGAVQRPPARRWSRDVDVSPDRRSGSDSEWQLDCDRQLREPAPKETPVARNTRMQPWAPPVAAAAPGSATGARAWAQAAGQAAVAHAHAGWAQAHRASRLGQKAGRALEEAAGAMDEDGASDSGSEDAEGAGPPESGGRGQGASLADARRVKMRFEPPALPREPVRAGGSGSPSNCSAGDDEARAGLDSEPRAPLHLRRSHAGDSGAGRRLQQPSRSGSSGAGGGGGGGRRRATTRAIATQTPVHEGTQTEAPAIVWPQAFPGVGFEQTPIGQGVSIALPGAPVQPPPPPFQQQHATPAAPGAGGAAIAAHQIGAGLGGPAGQPQPPHVAGLQPTPLVGGAVGQAAAHVVRSLFMGPATPAPLLCAHPGRAPCSRAELTASTPLAPPAALGAAIGMATAAAALSAAAAATAFMASPAVVHTPPVPRSRAAGHDASGGGAGPSCAAGAAQTLPGAGTPAPTPGARTPAFGYAPPSSAAGSPAMVPEPLPWPQMRGSRRSPVAICRHFSPMSAYGKHGGSASAAAVGAHLGAAAAAGAAIGVGAQDRTPATARVASRLSPLGLRSVGAAAGSPAVWAKSAAAAEAATDAAPRAGSSAPSHTPLRAMLSSQPSAAAAAAALAAAAAGPAVIPQRCLPPSAQAAMAQGTPVRTPLRERQAGPSTDGCCSRAQDRQQQQQQRQQQDHHYQNSKPRRQRAEAGSPELPPAAPNGGDAEGPAPSAGSPRRLEASEGKRQRKSSRAARPQPEMLRRYLASMDD